MIKKYVLIICIICLNFNFCISQNSKAYYDKYVIVLDIQPQFYHNKQLDSSATELIRNVNSLIDMFSPQKVIYIKAAGKILSISFKGFLVDTLVTDLDSNLKIVSNNIFTKLSGDAFTSAGLNILLESNNAKEIILVGLLAESCIYQTALGGKDKGYNMYIIPEAIIGKTPKKKEKAIKKMLEKGIKLLPLNEIISTP